MRVRVQWYGPFRELLGIKREEVEFSGKSVRDLYVSLAEGKLRRISELPVRVAVNDEVCEWETALLEGDLVVFLLPMGGG